MLILKCKLPIHSITGGIKMSKNGPIQRTRMKYFIAQQSRFCVDQMKEKFPDATREQIEKVITDVARKGGIIPLKGGYYEVYIPQKKPREKAYKYREEIRKYILSQEEIYIPCIRRDFSTTPIVINQILDELLEEKKIFQITSTRYWIKQPNIPEVSPKVKILINDYIQDHASFRVTDVVKEFPYVPCSVIYLMIENAEIVGWIGGQKGGFYIKR